MTRSEPLSMRPIRGVAVDQGSGLARMLRQARGAKAGKGDLLLFKRLVAEQLSPEASTLLVDANYGRELLPSIAPGCESTGSAPETRHRLHSQSPRAATRCKALLQGQAQAEGSRSRNAEADRRNRKS